MFSILIFIYFFLTYFVLKISSLFAFVSSRDGLHPQCKLDLESAVSACESKPRLSFQFSPQLRDLYAQRAAAG